MTEPGTFFGDPAQSATDATVNLVSGLVEHRFASRVTLRNRFSYGDYDKFYQNVFPGAVNAAGTTVAISAHNNATARRNLFNQTDLIVLAQTGRIGHTLLFGTRARTPGDEQLQGDRFLLEPWRQRHHLQCAAGISHDLPAA